MDEKKNSNSKKIFNMIDVLKSGGMRWIERQGGQGRWDERERERESRGRVQSDCKERERRILSVHSRALLSPRLYI